MAERISTEVTEKKIYMVFAETPEGLSFKITAIHQEGDGDYSEIVRVFEEDVERQWDCREVFLVEVKKINMGKTKTSQQTVSSMSLSSLPSDYHALGHHIC